MATMHEKAKNFFSFLSDTYLKYFPPPPSEETEIVSDEPPPVKDDQISSYIRSIGSEKADFKQFQFGYLAVLCNHEKIRPKVEIVKDLYKNEEQLLQVVQNVRNFCKRARTGIEIIDSIPDEEMKLFISKFSRYINLFTLMYFNKN